MKVINPEYITSLATLARASTGTWWDEAGALQTSAINVVRFTWNRATHDFKGVLVEPAATNLLLNNTTLSTQTRTVSSSTTYTVSFYGTGSIVLSGAASATIAGTGATVLTTLSFNTSSTSLTLTVSGSVTYAQLETGYDATSVIITAGSAVTRSADVVTGTGIFYSDFVDATAAYAGGTTYALAAVVQYDNHIYESLQASNTGHTPSSSPTWWLDLGVTNPFKMFDGLTSTQSLGVAVKQYVAVALSADAGAIGVANVANVTDIELVVGDGYSFFAYAIKSGAPTNGAVTTSSVGNIVTLAFDNTTVGPPSPGFPAVGVVVVGESIDLGETRVGSSVALIDYSRKATDEFGVTTFVERPYSKRLTCQTVVQRADYNTVHDAVFALRATPSIWISEEEGVYSSGAVVFGFVRDFRSVIDYPTQSTCSFEIEGLA